MGRGKKWSSDECERVAIASNNDCSGSQGNATFVLAETNEVTITKYVCNFRKL